MRSQALGHLSDERRLADARSSRDQEVRSGFHGWIHRPHHSGQSLAQGRPAGGAGSPLSSRSVAPWRCCQQRSPSRTRRRHSVPRLVRAPQIVIRGASVVDDEDTAPPFAGRGVTPIGDASRSIHSEGGSAGSRIEKRPMPTPRAKLTTRSALSRIRRRRSRTRAHVWQNCRLCQKRHRSRSMRWPHSAQ